MNGPRGLQVSPDDLLAAAAAFGPARHLSDGGACRYVRAIAVQMGAPEAAVASFDLSRRLTAALDVLDGRRADLRRGLMSAASAYATSDVRVAREMRPAS